MATVYETTTSLIRHKGTVCEVWRREDPGHSLKMSGTRRARQIAERHWLRRKTEWFCSGGTDRTEITIRMPGQNPRNLIKPSSWSC